MQINWLFSIWCQFLLKGISEQRLNINNIEVSVEILWDEVSIFELTLHGIVFIKAQKICAC